VNLQGARAQSGRPAQANFQAVAGAFDMAFLPAHGGQVTLQVAAGAGAAGASTAGGFSWTLSPAAAKVAARPGPHTLAAPLGKGEVRVQSLHVTGGALVAGTSLDQVARTIDKVEAIVTTPRGTTGTITAAEAGGQVIIEVSDDGPGVPAEQLPHVFERFYRARAHPSRPGSGLGLAIAAEITAAHGGSAQAAAASPNGLRVTLALPVRPPSRPRAGRELAASAG
jgi:Histidine kinase-, DNA gyrase B-, and HSP90-like ATPase